MHFAFQGNWKFKLCAAIGLSLWALMGVAQTAPQVLFKTSLGEFTVEVYPNKAPKTVDNFLRYVKDKHYDGTVFHRVMDGFMVQGGGFTADMKQKPTRAPIALEAMNGLKNEVGTIAMARTSDPNSATSQFFINVVNNPGLNAPQPDGYGYTVFGKVVAGMDVVDKIRAVPVGNQGMFQNVPRTPITIVSVNLSK
jgi:peptidyl-prolyl cis-trans isomerase A (cyclophilin A)